MWILPKNLQLSSGAPDTAGFISDLNEQSQICASSLTVRSKPSAARIWLQKWKRDSWTQHLSGRILRPSHARTFVTEWTSLWPVTPANHFPQPESDSAQKTLATSGHTSPDQYELFDLDYASLRMSKDISPLASEKSLESWNQSVTKRRGEYSARLKSAHRTNASGSSSWPSPIASEVRQGFQDRSRGMKGSQESLTTVVVKDAANWLTPQEDDSSNVNPKDTRRAGLVSQVNGQAAPANPSTDGSRPESWATPRDQDHKHSLPTEYEMQSRMHNQLLHMQTGGKLNPRWVETLQGVCMGWTSPSCPASVIKNWPKFVSGWCAVTIEPTSFDSSATESCLPQPSELFAF